ncbi:MAG TPA: HEPN domain-containing protein [Methanosarcinales archaeon]|nr:HEPN domain-containing protein [Methanosarcinales archaeon]
MYIDDVKVILLMIANKRILVAEEYLELAKHLLNNNLQYRSVISRAYYAMYHAARAAVYIQMRLDVSK